MAEIVLKDVCKVFEKNQYAVKDFSLHIRDGEFIVFVGPSGCGKSTTLRMIAGLEDISSGELWIDDELSNYTEPGQRDLSMVFQSYALYPQMSVYDNMAFSLSVRKVPKDEIRQRVTQAAEMLGITSLLDRRPAALSGGQKQRVAIGSAIMRKPRAFLMDEPLSNLDAKLRTHMRVELAELHHKLGTTFIYVTHDQVEAMTLADRIVVMKAGIVQQVAAPEELYNRPANLFVAGFIGSPAMNFMPGTVRKADGCAEFVTNAGQVFALTNRQADVLLPAYAGKAVTLGIRPEDLTARPARPGGHYASMSGRVTACEGLGHYAILHLLNGDGEFAARVEPADAAETDTEKTLCLDMAAAHFFDGETGENIFFQWRNDA